MSGIALHGGVIEDYRGDGFKAGFGVPLTRTTTAEIGRDAVHAVNCALAMERELKPLNTLWQTQGLPTARARMGIFTGPLSDRFLPSLGASPVEYRL